MNVTYSEESRQWREGFSLLQHATTQLEEILGRSTAAVKAEWERGNDKKGRPIAVLRLADWTGEVSGDFTLDELQSLPRLRYRLIRLSGDLLQARSHKLLEELTRSES